MEKQRVNFTELLDIDEITHYNNKPFTGIAFQLYDSNELQHEVEIVNGLKNGNWDYNGFSTDWCGIEEDDDNETRQKKWDDYKAKFPKATSIKHFDIENKKS